MATPTLTIQLDKATYAVNEPIAARLIVSGAGPESRTITGTTVVDGVTLNATATFTLTHTVSGQTVPGFTKSATDPNLFNGTAS